MRNSAKHTQILENILLQIINSEQITKIMC